jgi:hypothetical protein
MTSEEKCVIEKLIRDLKLIMIKQIRKSNWKEVEGIKESIVDLKDALEYRIRYELYCDTTEFERLMEKAGIKK